ncbi:MAG: TfoX/Sxy family protein [Rubrivivax sp.]|nr:TfoX/Sxy family protein [Rubrivivax sp.]
MTQAFVDHCLELLAPLGPVRARRMFGGHGLYAGGLFVALIAGERLYVKVGADTEARFAAAGCEPFVYEGQTRPVRLSYWTVPDEAMESPSLMLPWARLAMQAAVKAAAARAPLSKAAAARGKVQPGAAPRAPKARPPRPRRCRPAVPGARRRRASGRRPGRLRASA